MNYYALSLLNIIIFLVISISKHFKVMPFRGILLWIVVVLTCIEIYFLWQVRHQKIRREKILIVGYILINITYVICSSLGLI